MVGLKGCQIALRQLCRKTAPRAEPSLGKFPPQMQLPKITKDTLVDAALAKEQLWKQLCRALHPTESFLVN
eukprot:1157252-Pelagomonas_calceolata.AAC.5